MNVDGKRYAAASVKALDGGAWPHGGFEATLSMAALDRDGEVIDAHAFEPLPKSIPIFGDHVATIATTVGRAEPYYEDGVLKARGVFASDDYSQMVREKVKGGFVDSMSVGFMAPQSYKGADGVAHTGRAELLEASFVPIPSLRQATVSMAKSVADDLLDVMKAGRRNSAKDAKLIQTAHDALVAAGADCSGEKGAEVETTKDAPPALADAPEDETDPSEVAQALDQIIDAAQAAADAGDTEAMAALITGAGVAVDTLLDLLGVADPA